MLENWTKSFLHPSLMLSTWFYTGLIPVAPGTFGSLAALPFAWLILDFSNKMILASAALILFVVGLWASRIYMEETGKTDPGEIVIDEVVGQWLVCLMITDHTHPGQYFLALLAFRLFDIMKPWPITLFDKRHDAYGVMADDVVAGIMGAAVLFAANYYVL